MCPGRRERGTWPGDSQPCALVLAALSRPLPPYLQQGRTNSTDRRPGFAEMWQAAGFGKDVGKQNSRLQSDSAKPEDAAAEASNPSSPTLSITPLFPCCQPVGPALFKREVRGLASKTDVRFTEISSHQEGQEGLIQSGRARSHSHSLFLDSFVSPFLFPPSLLMHSTLICYLSACPSSARAPFCLFLSRPISIHPAA